ncbi:MAG: hypothetical protein EYC68_01715 [Chloroflexota bacterium]|nr:MAG: hypothetical protein EYC68_01715 [Chloroflexota bacterium]
MRRFLFQVVVDFIALVIVLFIVTILSVATGSNVDATTQLAGLQFAVSVLPIVAGFAVILTTVHWFVRPVLVILFGGWVIRSFGLFVVVLDIFLFYFAIFLSPATFQIAEPRWIWTTLGALLFDVMSLIVGTLFGVNRPRLDMTRANDAVWKQLEKLPSMRRSSVNENLRLQEVYNTFLSYGLEIGLAETPVGRFRRSVTKLVYGKPNPIDELSTPGKIRTMLQQLGPTYVKFGQMASSQSQTLPPDWAAELAKLQSDVPPVPYEQAREVIVSELGKPPEELFATFDETAMAAASTAQVHRATLRDGTLVAVKIQRPNIVAMVKADLGILQDVSNVAENVSSYARDLDLSGILAEFADGVIRELDYHNEAYYAMRLADNMQSIQGVHVPTVYPDLSATRVLTMEFIKGVKVNKPGALDNPNIDRLAVTRTFMRAFIKQIFIDGFFHGDPHPGNIFVNRDTGELTYLDLGLVGRLDQTKRLDLIDLLVSFSQNDSESIANLALRLSKKTRPVNVNQFRDNMGELLNQYVRYAAHPSFEAMISEFFGLLQRYGLRLDKQFTLAIKAVVQSTAVVDALGGGVDFVPFAVQEIQTLALAEITQDKVIGTVKQQVTAVGKELLRRVPNLQDATVSWLDQYMAGKFVVHVDTRDLSQHVDNLDTTFTRLTAGLIVTGMIIGTAVVTSQIWNFQATGNLLYPMLAVAVFIILLLFGAAMVWRMLRPPRRPYVE